MFMKFYDCVKMCCYYGFLDNTGTFYTCTCLVLDIGNTLYTLICIIYVGKEEMEGNVQNNSKK